jgi:nitrate reductase (NAD(P)H)
MVSPEQSAKEPKWWYDDRYAIYDLNVNSAVVHPQHEEVLRPAKAGPDATYTAQGYAYAGGGRRINRVEISLDKGKCKQTCHDLHHVKEKLTSS